MSKDEILLPWLSHTRIICCIFGYSSDTLNIPDPRSSYNMTRKIHNLYLPTFLLKSGRFLRGSACFPYISDLDIGRLGWVVLEIFWFSTSWHISQGVALSRRRWLLLEISRENPGDLPIFRATPRFYGRVDRYNN